MSECRDTCGRFHALDCPNHPGSQSVRTPSRVCDCKLRERIERLIAPDLIYSDDTGESRESRKVHVRVRDLRRILDINAVPPRTPEGWECWPGVDR